MQFVLQIFFSMNLVCSKSALKLHSFYNHADDPKASSCPAVMNRFDTTNALEGIQRIESENGVGKTILSFEHFKHGGGWDGLYVNPEKKFAFCMIAKSG